MSDVGQTGWQSRPASGPSTGKNEGRRRESSTWNVPGSQGIDQKDEGESPVLRLEQAKVKHGEKSASTNSLQPESKPQKEVDDLTHAMSSLQFVPMSVRMRDKKST